MKFMRRKSGIFVSPGDYLGVIEEFFSGSGTFVEDGNIYSSTTGHLIMDLNDRRVSVYTKTRIPLTPKEGNSVLGEVTNISNKNLKVRIFQIEDKPLYTSFFGIMHISDVSKGYVKTMVDAFKIGDTIRAKVISTTNGEIHLTTQGDELGVIHAKCSFCGDNLVQYKKQLRCSQCDRIRWRKTASDYGN